MFGDVLPRARHLHDDVVPLVWWPPPGPAVLHESLVCGQVDRWKVDSWTADEGRDPHGRSQREAHRDSRLNLHGQRHGCAGSWRRLSSIPTVNASTNAVATPILNISVKATVDFSATAPQLPPWSTADLVMTSMRSDN